ncbi:MAG: hypothetical protein IT379_22690 [Deltaproteobacteria bacterium]|nr:hypothetical protein [Deltaproteobacteria bacterium]
MTFRIGPSAPPSGPVTPTPTRAPATRTSNAAGAQPPGGGGEPELRIYAPRRPFREVLRETRDERPSPRTPTAGTVAGPVRGAASAPAGSGQSASVSPHETPAGPLRETAVELLRDVARGERFVRSVMRRAARGADFSPQELLAIQAGVYRYTQELELVSKIVDKGTAAVRQTLQSQS